MVEVEIGGNGAMSDMEESGKQNGRPQEHGQGKGGPLLGKSMPRVVLYISYRRGGKSHWPDRNNTCFRALIISMMPPWGGDHKFKLGYGKATDLE